MASSPAIDVRTIHIDIPEDVPVGSFIEISHPAWWMNDAPITEIVKVIAPGTVKRGMIATVPYNWPAGNVLRLIEGDTGDE